MNTRNLVLLALSLLLIPPGGDGLGASAATPDEGKIAFVRLTSDRWQLWMMDADGSNPRQLTTSPVDKHSPSWCPGNKVIHVFTIYGESVLYDLETGEEELQLPVVAPSLVDPDGKPVRFDPDLEDKLEAAGLLAPPGLDAAIETNGPKCPRFCSSMDFLERLSFFRGAEPKIVGTGSR